MKLRRCAAQLMDTVYFGGGTPSLLEPRALRKILDTLRENTTFARPTTRSGDLMPEMTLEADPETITPEKAAAWLDCGIQSRQPGRAIVQRCAN